jgi:hypothetical protein
MNKELENTLIEIRNIIPKVTLNDGKEYETLDLYYYQQGLWISKISTTVDKKLINNSNHFINHIIKTNDWGQENGYYPPYKRKEHKIYSRIVKNYYDIINSKIDPVIIEDKCIFLHNSFSTGNAGHDLFCILNILMKYKDVPDIKFVLFDEIDSNNNYHIIKLFIDDEKIIKIKSKQIYNFTKQVFNFEIDNHGPIIFNYIDIINDIKKQIIEKVETIYSNEYYQKLKNKKVILVKNNNNKYVVRTDDCFNANLLFNYLNTKNDWYICNPEIDNFFIFTYTLLHAKLIIIGQQGISCCNQIYFNNDNNCEIIPMIRSGDCYRKLCDNICNCGNQNLYLRDNNIVRISPTHPYDNKMCNGLYFSRIKNILVSPRNIKEENVEQFTKIMDTLN